MTGLIESCCRMIEVSDAHAKIFREILGGASHRSTLVSITLGAAHGHRCYLSFAPCERLLEPRRERAPLHGRAGPRWRFEPARFGIYRNASARKTRNPQRRE